MDIYQFLNEHGIDFVRHDHPPVYTVDDVNRLIPSLPGAKTKNLFFRDKKGKRHIILVVDDQKKVSFKDIERQTGLTHLSMGSPERLMRYLGVTPGAVSLLALINDADNGVEVLIDRDLWGGDAIQAHPLVNTATVVMAIPDMERFIDNSGHSIQLVDVP